MPWNGSGIFQRLFSWAQDAQNNVNIQGARMDQDTNDIVAGLNNCLTRDGQGVPGAAINWNGQRLYNVATPAVAADVANKGYVDTANATQAKNMAGYQINALGAPSSATDAATKGYVDSSVVSTSLPGLAGNLGKVLTGTGGGVTWTLPGIGTIDGTITSPATLTGAYQYVPVAMSSALQAVTLPDATTLQLGGPHYWMRNNGTFPFELRDHSGVLIAFVPVRGQILVTMTGNGAAAGNWTVGNLSEFGNLNSVALGAQYVDTTAGSFAGQQLQTVALSANTYLLCWGGSNGAGAVAATLSGTTVSFGTETGVMSANNMVSIAEISPTAVLVVGAGVNSSIPEALVLTLSGTTISVGSALNIGTSAQSGTTSGCTVLSSTLALAVWLGSGHVYSEAITMSGSTLTANTVFNLDSVFTTSSGYTPSVTAISGTSALVVGLTSANNMGAAVLTVSGTTVSTGTALTGIDTACVINTVQALGGGSFLVTYNTAGTTAVPSGAVKLVVLSVSGTTVTAGSPVTVASAGGFCNSVLQSAQGFTGYCYYCLSGNGYYAVPFTVNCNAVTLNNSTTQITSTNGSSNILGALNISGTGTSLLFGATSSNNPFGQTVEFIK